MAPENLPAALLELAELEQREHGLETIRRTLRNLLAGSPKQLRRGLERELSAERRDVHRRIKAVRAEVRPLLAQARR